MKTETAMRGSTHIIAIMAICLLPHRAWAHCDSLDGPVIQDARLALEKGDSNPVLKWVKKEHEGEIKEAFRLSLAVREKGADAKALAERYFFELLVRIHRAGEGEAFTGLKPAGSRLASHGAPHTHHEPPPH